METEWVADRARLRTLAEQEPTWSYATYSATLNRSLTWVKKWLARLRTAPPNDDAVLHSQSRARHTPPPTVAPQAVTRLLELRDTAPDNLQRTPGPLALIYFLQHDATLKEAGITPPRSTATVWRILRQHGRIALKPTRRHTPVDLPPPMTSWQLDFKDPALPATDPLGKQQHVVEILNVVDVGTSVWLSQVPRPDYTMATAIATLAEIVQQHGLPDHITFDRDSRFVGSQLPRDVPSPFLRFWYCLGVRVTLCPPRRPDLNGFVERLHLTLTTECLYRFQPKDLPMLRKSLGWFQTHYNQERPHQGRSCQNQPPRMAFPELPTRPAVPAMVDPDRWVKVLDGTRYVRRIDKAGSLRWQRMLYYVGRHWRGQIAELRIDAATKQLVVTVGTEEIKRVSIKGLVGQLLPFERWIDHLVEAARHEKNVARYLRNTMY